MTDLYKKIIQAAEKYNNTDDLLKSIYGLDANADYDCIVIAPSWLPDKILKNIDCEITVVKRHAYFGSYLIKREKHQIAWIQCASGAGNLIDAVLTLGKSKCDKIVFVGAVGALKDDVKLGELVTPHYSLAYEGGSLYTYEQIDVKGFGKRVYPNQPDFIKKVHEICRQNNMVMKEKVVYCTDSIICEYLHLEQIKSLGCDLIEMETAAFYRCLELMNKKGIALLCVSDNSATNISLVARTEEETRTFHHAREVQIPKILFGICDL
jgi:purine-nucleoside phosphorylase